MSRRREINLSCPVRYEKDMKVNMEHEHERLEKLCGQEAEQISRLEKVLALIETFEERTQPYAPQPLRLDECADLFIKLQVCYEIVR